MYELLHHILRALRLPRARLPRHQDALVPPAPAQAVVRPRRSPVHVRRDLGTGARGGVVLLDRGTVDAQIRVRVDDDEDVTDESLEMEMLVQKFCDEVKVERCRRLVKK